VRRGGSQERGGEPVPARPASDEEAGHGPDQRVVHRGQRPRPRQPRV